MHRAFKLPVERGGVRRFRPLEGEILTTFRDQYKRLRWIIIDEISMLSSENFNMIHKRILELFPSDNEGAKPFGGLNALLFGDLYQLMPVNGHWAFKQPVINEPYLWPYFHFVELTNVRQENDRRILDLCNDIRVGTVSSEDLELVKTRNIDNFPITAFADTLTVVPRNAIANQYNGEARII